MSYRITIIEVRDEKRIEGKTWQVVGTEEVARDDRFIEGCDKRTRIKEVYGHTPEVERTVRVEREVLKQEVDYLDLAAVIKAVNKL